MTFLISLHANAVDARDCQDRVEYRGATQVQVHYATDSQSCYLSIHPYKAQNLVYRDFLFTSEGNFMVFNSFGPGPDGTTTGAREYMVFPRPNQTAQFTWNDDQHQLIVTHVTGEKFILDYDKTEVVAISNGTITTAKDVRPENNGGVEFTKYNGLRLDSGYKTGSAPTGIASGTSRFIDAKSHTCSVKNSEIFKYTSEGDVIFKFSDKDLKSFLKSRCPQITL
jgi:hypothetical protein